MGKIKFGTDGWRAVISEDFTFDNVRVVAQAIGDFVKGVPPSLSHGGIPPYVNNGGKKPRRKKVLAVGYDTRFLSSEYALTLSLVLAANGIKVILSDRPTPTPSVSFAIWRRGLSGGVMITASHNPARYNGIKYKDSLGGSAGDSIIERIESKLYKTGVKSISKDEAVKRGLLHFENILDPHIKFITRFVNMRLLKKFKCKVAIDSMNGAGLDILGRILKNTAVKATLLNSEINPNLGNRSPEPNEIELRDFNNLVAKSRFDLGLATDGDADRLGVTMPDGKFLTGHKIMALILLHLIEDRKWRGGVVQTICGTMLINKICRKYGLKLYETPVGFKYISEKFEKEDILLGGEETGGVAYKKSIPERDGILSALLVLEALAWRKKGIKELLKEMDREYGTFEYKRLDLYFPAEKRTRLITALKKNPLKEVLGKRVVDVKSYDGVKFVLHDQTWLMFRPSGTEPKLRIYAEAGTVNEALRMLEFGRRFALKA